MPVTFPHDLAMAPDHPSFQDKKQDQSHQHDRRASIAACFLDCLGAPFPLCENG
jgi:hypothetical protein